jgi:rhodanese-related sulfurtransferase
VLGGIDSIDEILKRGNRPLTVKEFQTVWEVENALVIDARTKDEFPKEFIPGSIYVGIDDSFAPWVGTLVTDLKQPILFVADAGREEEVVTRLARVGYDHTLGYLKGGIQAWRNAGNEVDSIEEITPEEFAPLFDTHINLNVLDVRRKSEYDAEHLVGVENFPLDFINLNMSMLDNRKKYFLHCAGGYRSVIAASILKARGFQNVVNIKGGYKALSQTSLARTDHKEVNTEL